MKKTRDYIVKVAENSRRMVEPDSIMNELSGKIRQMEQKARERRFGSSNSGAYNDNGPAPYIQEAFPPCVRKCMEGIKSGGRNDAIVLFLTPFISYARLAPNVFSMEYDMKVSDVDPSLEITHKEVIPMIYEAANACRPPLFKDQPQEKININSKLGFGMNSELKLSEEGETRWYTPMSCEKIKLHMPNLCIPCVDCKKIGNPLIYYNRKKRLLEKNNSKATAGEEK